MFERLREPIENVQDYLDRISCGPSEEIRQDRECLDRLIRNHQKIGRASCRERVLFRV